MTQTAPASTPDADMTAAAGGVAPTADDLVVEDVLVEEVSIDGMCGVY